MPCWLAYTLGFSALGFIQFQEGIMAQIGRLKLLECWSFSGFSSNDFNHRVAESKYRHYCDAESFTGENLQGSLKLQIMIFTTWCPCYLYSNFWVTILESVITALWHMMKRVLEANKAGNHCSAVSMHGRLFILQCMRWVLWDWIYLCVHRTFHLHSLVTMSLPQYIQYYISLH